MKINLIFLEDKEFEEKFDYCLLEGTSAITLYTYYGVDITIYVRMSVKNKLWYVIPLLMHEYIHAVLFILLGWNYKLRKIQNILDYINEVIWVPIREVIKMISNIVKYEKGYYKEYWNKR